MHSPLKDPRTRYAGQSLSERIRDISEDQTSELIVPFLLAAVVAVVWGYHLSPGKPNPWVITAVALLASAWSIRRIVVLGKQKAKLLKRLLGEAD